MRDYLLSLQARIEVLDPQSSQIKSIENEVLHFIHQFQDQLPLDKAYKPIPSMKGKMELSDEPLDLKGILNQLKNDMLNIGLNPASGGHLGYIPGGGLYTGALGDLMAAVFNQYAGIFYGGPGAVKMENELIRWLCRWMSYPESALGNLTSGGSIANLIAFVTARESKKIKAADYHKQCIYLSPQVHHCVHKAIRICGMQEAQIRMIRLDNKFRIDPEDLEYRIKEDISTGLIPFIVVGNAGTTDTGVVDPLDAIADTAEKYQLWFHVDAAYGGFFATVDLKGPDGISVKQKFAGIERSDSLAIDPHKGMFLSYGLGAVLIKNVEAQFNAHYYKAAYMQDTLNSQEELSPADLSPELTKHFRGLRLWLPLRLYGFEPFRLALEEKILLCRFFYEKVSELGFETGPFPDLSVCIFRWNNFRDDSNEWNKKILEFVVKDGSVFLSSTTIDGIFWIRIAILSIRTHLREIELCLQILKEAKSTVLPK